MGYQPQFVPPSQPVPPSAPGYSPPIGGYTQPPMGYSPVSTDVPPGYLTVPQPATYVVRQLPRPQRPAVVAMSASMTVTASALWVCALALGWLLAAALQARLQADQDFDGQVLIMLNRFSARLLDGLAIPLFGLPTVAFVAAFLLLSGRRWAQLFYTVLGAATVGWLIWWLHDRWAWAAAPIAYVVVSVVILWTPAAVRWFGRTRP